MRRKLIKISKIVLVCITIASTLIITCYADNQLSKLPGQVRSTTGVVWCSYGVGLTGDNQQILYADNINITPTYIPTNYAESVIEVDQEIYYSSGDNAGEVIANSSSLFQWKNWERVEYTSPVTNELTDAFVGMYDCYFEPPQILTEYANNGTVQLTIKFEDILTWNEDYIDVGDKQATITPVIKIPKSHVNNVEDLISGGYLHTEKLGGTQEDVKTWVWKPNIIERENEYWIIMDNIARPDATDYKAIYKNDGHFYINVNTLNDNELPIIQCKSEVIVLDDMDKIISKAIEENAKEAHLIPVADFGSWIANSISGFMNFTIMEGVSIGGIFIMLISFATVMWLLKLFAGG